MASSRLFKDARAEFVRSCESRYTEPKDIELLRDFLSQQGSPEEAQQAAHSLKTDAGKKWGAKKVGDAEIPGAWIDSIMGNISNFVEVGNYAMQGAPESVGLAWFAVKLTLSAIQSNYALYHLFGSGLTDISEIMIIIPHYDRLYDERAKAKTEWKQSAIVDKLFKNIVSAYVAVLSFSFSVRRHLSAGTMARVRHGFKDFFGASESKFRSKLDHIAVLKKKVVEDSQAIFQEKTLHQLESVKGIVSDIEGAVNHVRDFQQTLKKMHEEQAAQWQTFLKKMEEIKANTKPITTWDQALLIFEKNKDALNPQKDTGDALSAAIDRRHPGTCQWIFDLPMYNDWKAPSANKLLCLSGEQGSGKSVVLATIIEQMDDRDGNPSTLLYFSCSTKRSSAKKGALSVDDVCHTILYQLYRLAREDETNVKLLEDCNKVFANPKASKIGRRKILSQSNKDEKLPDFVDGFLGLAELFKRHIIIAVDEIDCLEPNDQKELAYRLKAVVDPSESPPSADSTIKVVAGCRSGTEFPAQLPSEEIDVGSFNKGDILTTLSVDLQSVPGLTEDEQKEAAMAISENAGPRFTYIHDIALPFMREPFKRPLSRRLEDLPKGMNNIYNETLRKMSPNYVELLQTALTWTLLAPIPLKVEEVMDAYHGTYRDRGAEVEEEARNLTEARFTKAPALELEQLRTASGPFLRVEQVTVNTYLPVAETDHIVTLRDPLLVKDFCLRDPTPGSPEHLPDGEICAHCKLALAESKSLTVSPKEGHLQLALACLRHLNNPIFQRRATAAEDIPQWSKAGQPASVGSPNEAAEEKSHDEEEKPAEEEVTASPDQAAEPSVDTENKRDGFERESLVDPTSEGGIKEEDPEDQGENGETKNDDDDDGGNDSDDSLDDEDRGEISLAKELEANSEGDVDEGDATFRKNRYELWYWTYHVRQAEGLWEPEERKDNPLWAELMDELDHFTFSNPAFFHWWLGQYEHIASNRDGLKPLHAAAFVTLASWAEHLLNKGADPNELSGSPQSMTPIQFASISAKSRPVLQLLLEKGANPNAESEHTIPAFHYWLLNDSSIETVQLMLKHGADTTLKDKVNGWTSLHYFAWQGNDVEALEMLLDHSVDGIKADINAVDNSEYSPLHVLLWRREVPKPLLRAFLKHGADVNKDNSQSSRPLQLASVWGELETLQILSESVTEIDDDNIDGDSALHQAAIGNHPKCLQFLAEKGADPNMQNKRGRAALHTSAWQGAKDCVEILLAHGAELNMVDKHNRTPFFFACLGESLETTSLLLDALIAAKTPMIEINKLTKRHRTPLRQAAGRGFDAVIEKMIKTAQDQGEIAALALNQADTRKGMTPLHRAAWFGKAKSVRLLLDAGADVSCLDFNKKSALVLAYEQWALASHQNSFEDIISLLVAGDPETAIHDAELVAICATNGSTRLLQQLCELGADLNRQDRYGWTPLDLARKFQQTSASRFLKQQAAWAGMLPSQWAPDTRTNVNENGTAVSHTSHEQVCLSTDKPLPAGLDTFYFEITSKAPDGVVPETAPILAIGFCTIGGRAIRFPGWPATPAAPSARSWGYHGDDGGCFNSATDDGRAEVYESPYKAPDTVGAGVDLTTGKIWFTRNGEKLATGFEGVQGRLFPLLGLEDPIEVETNFKGPFKWSEAKGKE